MTWPQWVAVALLLLAVVLAVRALMRGARRQREESAYAAMKQIAQQKVVHRFPPMTERAAKGFGRDETIGRDQVSRVERMH